MKILLITSRNAYSTSGELRLIKNRAKTLSEVYGVQTDVIVFRHKKTMKKAQEKLNCGEFIIKTYSWISYLFVKNKLKNLIKKEIGRKKYRVVVLSGVVVFPLISYLKPLFPNVKFIADIHGAYEELIEFSGRNQIQTYIRRLYYKYAKHEEQKFLPLYNAYFVVSKALMNYVKKEYSIENNCFFIVPCAIQETSLDVETVKKNRIKYRQKYGLKDNDLLFVYSGGVSPWQCIEKSVEMYKHFSTDKNNTKLLLMSNNKEYLSKFASDNILIDSYPAEEVRRVLCACDYAFLLRQDLTTNNVAYPNKFLEYVSCGLKIITTDYVYDVAEQTKKYKLGICVSLSEMLPDATFIDNKGFLDDIERRNTLLKETCFSTTLLPFVKYIQA